MIAWLSANLVTVALSAVLVLLVALLLRGMVRRKKAGTPSCDSCAACGVCGCCAEAQRSESDSK